MSKAMNGKNFERQLSAAAIKLSRASDGDGVDPESGFSKQAIIDFIVDLPELGNSEQIEQAKAVLRRNGAVEAADSFAV
jgi:hypothetical protein